MHTTFSSFSDLWGIQVTLLPRENQRRMWNTYRQRLKEAKKIKASRSILLGDYITFYFH